MPFLCSTQTKPSGGDSDSLFRFIRVLFERLGWDLNLFIHCTNYGDPPQNAGCLLDYYNSNIKNIFIDLIFRYNYEHELKIILMKKLLILIGFAILSFPSYSQNPDRRAVHNAVLDYVEAMYESSPERIDRSVHPELVKRGFYWKSANGVYSDMTTVTFAQLRQISKDWNRSGWLPADAIKEIELFDVKDKTALAKLTAHWGTEYFQLAKIEDQWMIMNILWQAEPKTSVITDN
jgi:hypothetical protein